jgi:hypothetical protein
MNIQSYIGAQSPCPRHILRPVPPKRLTGPIRLATPSHLSPGLSRPVQPSPAKSNHPSPVKKRQTSWLYLTTPRLSAPCRNSIHISEMGVAQVFQPAVSSNFQVGRALSLRISVKTCCLTDDVLRQFVAISNTLETTFSHGFIIQRNPLTPFAKIVPLLANLTK